MRSSRTRWKIPWSVVKRSTAVLLFYITVIVIWEIFVEVSGYPQYILPKPSSIGTALASQMSILLKDTYVTLYESLIGFGIGIVIGTVLAIAITYVKYLHDILYPLLVVINAIPKTAIAPLIVVWFGIGLYSKIVMAFLVSFFVVFINTMTGLLEIPPELIDTVHILNASKSQEYIKIRMPSASVVWFVGIKAALPLSIVGAIVAEFIAAREGLGYYMLIASSLVQTQNLFASLIMLAIVCYALYSLLELIERRLLKWSPSRRKR